MDIGFTFVRVESEGTLDNEELARVSLLECLCKVIALYRCKSLSLETYGKYCLTALPLGPEQNKIAKLGEEKFDKYFAVMLNPKKILLI